MTVNWDDGGNDGRDPRQAGKAEAGGEEGRLRVAGKELTFKDGDRKVFTAQLLPAQRSAAATDDDKGFVPLFNGKDLTGWKTHPSQPGNWRVENGILTGSSDGVSELYTDRGDYTDFHLRLEVRLNVGNGFRSTGVYFRAVRTQYTRQATWVSGYNAKIDANRLGGLLIDMNPELHRTREPVLRPGEWIPFEIIAEGNHVVIKVNGETTSDYTDEHRLYPKGHIVLQQHGAATVAQFRKIEIKELTPTKTAAPPAKTAAPPPAAADGFVSLFNGKDLTGWSVDSGAAERWKVERAKSRAWVSAPGTEAGCSAKGV